MLTISNNQRAKWLTGTAQKTLTISFPDISLTLTNSQIVSESLSLTEELESEEYLTFTGCIASRLSFKCQALNVDVRGQRIVVTLGIASETPLPLFIGYVDTQDNLTQRDVITQITAYDELVRVNETDVTDWYESLTFPMTIATFRAAFWTELGITEESTTLPNDSLSLSKSITDTSINAGKVAKWLCQLNARYGRINRSGNFEYVKLEPITEGLYPSESLYPADNLYPSEENYQAEVTNATYSKVTYEPYQTATITGVYIWDNGGINQGQAGSAGNVFNIADNPLAWGVSMATAAANIYAEIYNVKFIPAQVNAIGMPYMEVGDIIMFKTDNNIIRTYILSRTLNGIQALADTLISEAEQYLKVYKESAATLISSNGKSILKIEADIVEMNTLIADRATIAQLNATNLAVSGKASISDLNAVSARVGTLEADHVSVASLNAVNAKFNNLNASNITAGTLKVNRLEDYSGGSGSAQWSILGWVVGIDVIGSTLTVYYRDFKFLNSGYTDTRSQSFTLP